MIRPFTSLQTVQCDKNTNWAIFQKSHFWGGSNNEAPEINRCILPRLCQSGTHLGRTNPWKVSTATTGPSKKLLQFCKTDFSARTMAAFWTEIDGCAVTTNAPHSSLTCRHTPTPLMTPEKTIITIRYGPSDWSPHLSVCFTLGWKRPVIDSQLHPSPLSILNHAVFYKDPCAWVIAPVLDKGWVFLKTRTAVSVRFCSRTLPQGSMTLCYTSGRNQKLEHREDVVFFFKRRAITAHCQKPPTLLPSFQTPVYSPQLGCQ